MPLSSDAIEWQQIIILVLKRIALCPNGELGMLIIYFRITCSCDKNGKMSKCIYIIYIYDFLSESFWFSATMNVAHELELLVEEIKRLGSKSRSMSCFCALAAGMCVNTGRVFMWHIIPRYIKIKRTFPTNQIVQHTSTSVSCRKPAPLEPEKPVTHL